MSIFFVTEPELIDSWDAEDEPASTPDDDEIEELGEDGDQLTAIKPSKKKVIKVEDTKSKKEHVNVVFIGHVGKFHAP